MAERIQWETYARLDLGGLMKIEITDIPKNVNKIVIDVYNDDFSVKTFEPELHQIQPKTEIKNEDPREPIEIPEEMNSEF